jgi:secreted trypsin-like serine protease
MNTHRWTLPTACLGAGLLMAGAAPAATKVFCDDKLPDQTKIIGGSSASSKDWPWFASLRITNPAGNASVAFCGGTMVAPDWVLTAAHCLADIDPTTFAVPEGRLEAVLGVEDLRTATGDNVYPVAEIKIPAEYAAAYQEYLPKLKIYEEEKKTNPDAVAPPDPAQVVGYDIGLVRLARRWSGRPAPVSLGEETDPTAQTALRVAGFGLVEPELSDFIDLQRSYTDRNGNAIRAGCARLMQISMPMVDTQACRDRFSSAEFTPAIGNGQICAGYEKPGKDSCGGDSGGPLVAIDGQGKPYQVGLVSWGKRNCGDGIRPYGVYTRISAFTAWLKETLDALPVDREAALAARAANEQTNLLRSAIGELANDAAPGKGSIRLLDGSGLRIKLGDFYHFKIESDIAGRLIIVDVDAAGKVTQAFPNRYVNSDALLRIAAGETLVIPTRSRFAFDAFKAVEPVGEGRLVLAVVPDDFPIELTLGAERNAQQHKGFAPVVNPTPYLMNLVQQIKEEGFRATPAFAYDVVAYEIVH